MYYVYIVRASDDSLYSGITTDLERRVREHNSEKVGSKYLRSKRPVTLVYSETQVNRSAALKREAEIKSWSKKQKEKLVACALPYYQQEKQWTCSLANLRMVLASQQVTISEQDLVKEIVRIQKRRSKNVMNTDLANLAQQHSINCSLISSTNKALDEFVTGRHLFQVSIRTEKLYANGRGYHSLLIYKVSGGEVEYHDPLFGMALHVSRRKLLAAMKGTGAGILYVSEFALPV